MASLTTNSTCCSSVSYGVLSSTSHGLHAAVHVSAVSLWNRNLACIPLLQRTNSPQYCHHHPSRSTSRISSGRRSAAHQQARLNFRSSESAFEAGGGWTQQQQLCLCGEWSSGACSSSLGFRPSVTFSDHVAPGAVSSDRLGEDSEPESSSGEGRVEAILEPEVPISRKIALFQDAFWRFLRPHTIRGTLLGSSALVARALMENPHLIDWVLLPKALRGLLALVCGNGYIVGINQIYDVGIDKINKPFLPIAAGDLSIPVAWGLVLGLAALGVGIVGTNFGSLITVLYSFGLFLGTIYSVPPLHLKRFAVPAFLIIATVRGFLLNFGVYYATRAALGLPFEWNASIVFITSFVTVFATVIAITKDLPDIEGDRKFNISTFATRLGVRNMSFLGAGLLLANYVGAIVAAIYLPQSFNRKVMIPAHAVLAVGLVYQTLLLDSAKYTKDSIAGFYRFIWNLFYSEYTLLPFI